MGKRRWLAAGSSPLVAAIGLLWAATAASASTASPVVGYTYIDGFTRHADGSVTPLPGSPLQADCSAPIGAYAAWPAGGLGSSRRASTASSGCGPPS